MDDHAERAALWMDSPIPTATAAAVADFDAWGVVDEDPWRSSFRLSWYLYLPPAAVEAAPPTDVSCWANPAPYEYAVGRVTASR